MGNLKINPLEIYRTDLLPAYRKKFGDEETYPDAAGDFVKFLVEHEYHHILYVPGLKKAVMARFMEFLESGYCHKFSPAGRIMKVINEMKNAADPFTAYAAWLDFINQYVIWLRKLVSELGELKEKSVKLDSSYIEEFIEQSEAEFAAKKMDAELESFFSYLPDILKLFIGSQRGVIKSNRSALLFLKYEDRDIPYGHIDVMAAYDNPFEWIRVVYTNLEGLEKIYIRHDLSGRDAKIYTSREEIPRKQPANQDFGLIVKLNDRIPHERPADPALIRQLLDVLFFAGAMAGTRKKPAALNASWNTRKKSLIISSDSLGNIVGLKEWNHAEKLIAMADGQIHLKEGFIQIPFGKRKSGSTQNKRTDAETNKTGTEGPVSGLCSAGVTAQSVMRTALQSPAIIGPPSRIILGAAMSFTPAWSLTTPPLLPI
jgi:hypothetical protein